jgi:hypothetical protein
MQQGSSIGAPSPEGVKAVSPERLLHETSVYVADTELECKPYAVHHGLMICEIERKRKRW